MEEHHVMVSIEEYLCLDDPNRDYSDRYSSKEKSRFAVGCYKTHFLEFKLRVTAPLFLTPDVTYGLNLVLHASKIDGMKQQYVGVRYKIQGERKISILHFADKKEGKQLVAELYQFNSTEESILDLEILFQDCGLLGDFYVEGIEFLPLEKVERQVVIANQEIVRGLVPPLFYRFTEEESKVLLSQGVLLNRGKTWVSITEKGEHIERIYVEACLNLDKIKDDDLHHLSGDIVNSRFPGGLCYQYFSQFKARVRGEYLTPQLSYTLNLVFRYEDQSRFNLCNPLRYKIDGDDETKVFIIYPLYMRQDGWFIAPLYHFTSQQKTTDLQFVFEQRLLGMDLLVAGIEFQPSEEKVEPQVFEEYQDIVEAASQSLFYTSLDELKQILSIGVLLNGYKTWLSLNDKEEHHVMVSIEEYLCLDDPNRDYSDRYSFKKNSRFAVGCYKTRLMEFKLRVTTPLFLSPDVTYGLNLVLHTSEIEGMKQQYVGVRFKLQGETKFSILHFADKNKCKQLVAELYQFNSTEESILDLEIFLEDCGLSGEFYIEGIEFRPLEKMERQVVIANQEIVRGVVPPLIYRFTEEESKVLLSQGVLLNGGKTWLSLNDKEEHHVMVSIEEYLSLDDPNRDYSDRYSSKENSRFAVGCYKTHLMELKLRVTAPLFLSPDVIYKLSLVLHASEIEGMKQQYVGVMYKIQEETKISILHFADKNECKQLVAELYQFNSTEESILDLEIFLEDCGLSGEFYIEGIEFRPLENMERQVVIANQEIVRGVVPPLFHRFTEEESKVLLSQGVLLNRGKTWLCINEKGEHIERIYIQSCVGEIQAHRLKYQSDFDIVNSRFPGGLCYYYYWDFKARVRGEYLTPQISYTANLVFRYKDKSAVNKYYPLKYKIDGEDGTKVFIIYPSTHMREDGWFIVPLYHFTTQHSTADLQFHFEERSTYLLVAGIEFQPSEEKVELQVFEEYQDIVKAASQSLVYKSLQELKQILSKGIHLKDYKTWFSLNDKGQHCHMISMKDCLIPNEDFTPQYISHWWSRFPAGFYQTNNNGFKTHVKTQLLSPLITYTVNLVYKSSSNAKQVYVDLKYRLRGEETTSVVYLANKRDDDWFHIAELYQFTSDGSIVDLEIIFENSGINIDRVEGILFQPLEKVEDQLLEDDRVEHIETISDSDTYWEQKIPNDYEETLKLSKDSLEWKTKKGLYSILCKGFLLDDGHQWFSIDKNGKKCQMLSARAAVSVEDKNNSNWESSNESRFEEALVITGGYDFQIETMIEPQEVSPETSYAAYLVFKLPQDQSTFEAPMFVYEKDGYRSDSWYIYLVNPPHTPVIGPKFDENTYNPLNRYKGNAIPQQRTDGWMEVKVWKFQTTTKSVPMHLKFKQPGKKDLKGLMIQGVELRPI